MVAMGGLNGPMKHMGFVVLLFVCSTLVHSDAFRQEPDSDNDMGAQMFPHRPRTADEFDSEASSQHDGEAGEARFASGPQKPALKDRPPLKKPRALTPGFFSSSQPDMCKQKCNRRGKCMIDFTKVVETGIVRRYEYRCHCHPLWTGDTCQTPVDQLIRWYESKGHLEFPKCCNVCPSQFENPTNFDDLPVYKNPYSSLGCDTSQSADSRPEPGKPPCWRPLQYEPDKNYDQEDKASNAAADQAKPDQERTQPQTVFLELDQNLDRFLEHVTTQALHRATEEEHGYAEIPATPAMELDDTGASASINSDGATFGRDKPEEIPATGAVPEAQRAQWEAELDAHEERFQGVHHKFIGKVGKAIGDFVKKKAKKIGGHIKNFAKKIGGHIKNAFSHVAGALKTVFGMGAVTKVVYGGEKAKEVSDRKNSLQDTMVKRAASEYARRMQFPVAPCCVYCDFDFWQEMNSRPSSPWPKARGVHLLKTLEAQMIKERHMSKTLMREMRRREIVREQDEQRQAAEASFLEEELEEHLGAESGAEAEEYMKEKEELMMQETVRARIQRALLTSMGDGGEDSWHPRDPDFEFGPATWGSRERRRERLKETPEKRQERIMLRDELRAEQRAVRLNLKERRSAKRPNDNGKNKQDSRYAGPGQCCNVCPIPAQAPEPLHTNYTEEKGTGRSIPAFANGPDYTDKERQMQIAFLKKQQSPEYQKQQEEKDSKYRRFLWGRMRKGQRTSSCCNSCPSQFFLRTVAKYLGPFDGAEHILEHKVVDKHLGIEPPPDGAGSKSEGDTSGAGVVDAALQNPPPVT